MNLSRRNNIFYTFDPIPAFECQITFVFLCYLLMDVNNFHNIVKVHIFIKAIKNCLPIVRFPVIFSAYLSGPTSFRKEIIFTWNKQKRSINIMNCNFMKKKEIRTTLKHSRVT